jgi:hypothetical protein
MFIPFLTDSDPMSTMSFTGPPLPRRRCRPGKGAPGRVLAALGLALASLLLVFVCLTAAGAQSGAREATHEANLERNVKAAFLYKFLGYVDFPEAATPAAGEPFVIGVLGADGMADEVRRIAAGRSMNGRAVEVRKLRRGEAAGRLHLLFIADDDPADVDKALAAVRRTPVLTVTETPDSPGSPGSTHAPRSDSVINFRVVDERVRFEVSLEAAAKNNLKLSSRLLAVAYKVMRSGQ